MENKSQLNLVIRGMLLLLVGLLFSVTTIGCLVAYATADEGAPLDIEALIGVGTLMASASALALVGSIRTFRQLLKPGAEEWGIPLLIRSSALTAVSVVFVYLVVLAFADADYIQVENQTDFRALWITAAIMFAPVILMLRAAWKNYQRYRRQRGAARFEGPGPDPGEDL